MEKTNQYDWRKTRQPERPYLHAYHTSLVDKIFLCMKPNPEDGSPARVFCKFEDVLERIRKIDNLTRGIPKIFYLVGWQYDGHDSKYPAWSEANELLKRPEDRTALDSLRWLMQEARRYPATVSLHINMQDAYENSPLWEAYQKAGIIQGKGGKWGGEQAYLIDYAREWQTGLAQKRIDVLCEMLPLREAGTVHIDAFWPAVGDKEEQLTAMRTIVRYWREKGIDVTTECLVNSDLDDGLVGLCPMFWHINYDLWNRPDEFTEANYIEVPAWLLCGGEDHSYRSLLFGTNMQGEPIPNQRIGDYLSEFCLKTLPWQYLNRQARLGINREGATARVEYTSGLACCADLTKGTSTIEHGGVLLQDGSDLFVPALWQTEREIIAFSKVGYQRRHWTLPPNWQNERSVFASRITLDGLEPLGAIGVEGGRVELSLGPGEAMSLRAYP